MKLSVIIPIYNEQTTLEEILRRVRAVPVEKEIILVDDGSSDGSEQILEDLVYYLCRRPSSRRRS